MVFGSMVTGDLWDESDIDFFVITKEYPETLKNIYTDEKGISVHIRIMSKDPLILNHCLFQLLTPKLHYSVIPDI
jgi:predicted nucleotidyltransferase